MGSAKGCIGLQGFSKGWINQRVSSASAKGFVGFSKGLHWVTRIQQRVALGYKGSAKGGLTKGFRRLQQRVSSASAKGCIGLQGFSKGLHWVTRIQQRVSKVRQRVRLNPTEPSESMCESEV